MAEVIIMLPFNRYCILTSVAILLTGMENVTGFPQDWPVDSPDNNFQHHPSVIDDMILSPEQLQGVNEATSGFYSGIKDPTARWPKGIIPYRFDPAFNATEQSIIQNGMNLIQQPTVIRFKPRTSESSYVYIRKGEAGTGCYSHVGRNKNGVNILHLARGCMTRIGVIAHELIHAIGFHHEQSRTDRDDYVMIFWNNIEPSRKHAFYKYPKRYVTDFGIPYDYQSIMHYTQYAFAKDPKQPTILARASDPYKVILGQLERLTEYDARKINAMYAGLVSA